MLDELFQLMGLAEGSAAGIFRGDRRITHGRPLGAGGPLSLLSRRRIRGMPSQLRCDLERETDAREIGHAFEITAGRATAQVRVFRTREQLQLVAVDEILPAEIERLILVVHGPML